MKSLTPLAIHCFSCLVFMQASCASRTTSDAVPASKVDPQAVTEEALELSPWPEVPSECVLDLYRGKLEPIQETMAGSRCHTDLGSLNQGNSKTFFIKRVPLDMGFQLQVSEKTQSAPGVAVEVKTAPFTARGFDEPSVILVVWQNKAKVKYAICGGGMDHESPHDGTPNCVQRWLLTGADQELATSIAEATAQAYLVSE